MGDDRDQLLAENQRLAEEREHYRDLYLATLEKCRKLELGLRGPAREKLSAAESQLTMSLLEQLLGDGADETGDSDGEPEPDGADPGPKAATRRRSTGRRTLPAELPRIDIEVMPDEVQREGLDAFEKIGEEVRETVEYRPASTVVVRTRRPKFVRRDRERNAETEVVIAEPVDLPIEGGLAGPAMLAHSVVRRWQDHLPLNRLEGIYAREGLGFARSTLCGWHQQLRFLCAPLIAAMWCDAMASPYLCTDATGVLVRDTDKCHRGHFWVVVAPDKHILFAYSRRHNGAAVDSMLAGYEGYLVADAHAVYDHLYADGTVVEVGCWAHCRRYFFKALETEPQLAREALSLINRLFEVERAIADWPRKKREKRRRAKSRPIVDRFYDWCDHRAQTVLDDTPIAKAIRYARNQRTALYRFLEDGRLPLHNNISELQLRREAVGRKNWLFVGSDDGGHTNATFVTLLASAQLHGLEPAAYLRDLFCLLPTWPARRVLELAPAYFKQTLENTDAQQRLDANVFRRASLGLLDEHSAAT